MIYLRAVVDRHGDTDEYLWFCSESCYSADLAQNPPTAPDDRDDIPDGFTGGVGRGGAYPCGVEADYPEFCEHCSEPIGNPITDEGVETIRGWLSEPRPSALALAAAALYEITPTEGGDDD